MRRPRLASFAIACVLCAAIPARADAKGAHRAAWVGLSRGPLAPQRADQLEALILDELDGYDSFRLVDAGGNALDDRLLAAEASRAAKLIDEGVDHLLNFRHKKAVARFELAIEVFETRLTALRDQEILHEALLAKAEALFQSGKASAATETLKSLAALSPKKMPTKKTHPQKFVALYEKAVEDLGPPGRIMMEPPEQRGQLIIDGKPYESANGNDGLVISLLPGKHYVVMRWPFFSVSQAVQVAPGRDTFVRLVREGPAEQARSALLEAITLRQGADTAVSIAKRVADLSASDGVLIASVRVDGSQQALLLARHDDEGKIAAIGRVVLEESIDSDLLSIAVRRLGVAMFVDKRTGEFELTKDEAVPASGLAVALYGRGMMAGSSGEPDPVVAVPVEKPKVEEPREEIARTELPRVERKNGGGGNGSALTSPPVGVETEVDGAPITKRWWFWTGVGVALVGITVAGIVVLQPDAQSTKFDVVVVR